MALSVNIEKKFQDFYLKVKFEVENEVLAILGPSGCGKSMTLKCIAGIETPDKGKIILDGVTLFDSEKKINLPPQKRKVGYLFQQYALFPNMTVEQNIACGVKEKDRKDTVTKEMIQMMNLDGMEKKKPHQLSGGQQQRVALARILVNKPKVLLLDEPFSALDAHLKEQLQSEVREILCKFGKTAILVSHDKDEVYRLSDRVMTMMDGQAEAAGCKAKENKSGVLTYKEAVDRLVEVVKPIAKESVALEKAMGRILAQDVKAMANVPPFDRSPYDGYAFRAADSVGASKEHPVTLKILEEIPAGGISRCPVTEGCAVKILTGAPIPEGADAIVPFEVTEFTESIVTVFEESVSGKNIVKCGEDVKIGDGLANEGVKIDAGLAGTLASQNIAKPMVYRVPRVGILSTGSELLNVGDAWEEGKIYNSNQYMLQAAVRELGCEAIVLGRAKDSLGEIKKLLMRGLSDCDIVLITGGVSVGDYDLTPDAMEQAGISILFRGVGLKPGMACAYGVKGNQLVCGLSGNPASAITNFYAIAVPAIRKICGYKEFLSKEIRVTLLDSFGKKSRCERILRGKLELANGIVGMHISKDQGNVVLSSTIGCDVMAVIPAGSGPVEAGTKLKGFLI